MTTTFSEEIAAVKEAERRQFLSRVQGFVELAAGPKPEIADEFCVEFDRLKGLLVEAEKKAGDAAKPVGELKLKLVELVRRHGGAHAEKSKLLHGIQWEIVATFGQSIGQDSAAVERLRVALNSAGKTRLLKNLFTKRESWEFSTKAAEIVRGATAKDAKEKLTPKLAQMALACFVPRDNTPRLEVRRKKKAVG